MRFPCEKLVVCVARDLASARGWARRVQRAPRDRRAREEEESEPVILRSHERGQE